MALNNNIKNFSFLNKFINTFGVNSKKVKNVGLKVGLNPFNKGLNLKKKNINYITKQFKESDFDRILKLKIRKNIKFLIQIKSYRGIRHNLKLPSRGQRTKTNAKTKKSFKY